MKSSIEIINMIKKRYSMWDALSKQCDGDTEISAKADVLEDLLESIGEPRTLVIHPSDWTTDFLKPIYEGKDWTVINEPVSKKDLIHEIKSHDRIIMLGHGTEYGLIGYHGTTLIDSSWLYLLRDKDLVGIWCNADVFFDKYNLSGLYTGMFVSEFQEAEMFIDQDYKFHEITTSNELFSKVVGEHIDEHNVVTKIYENYKSETNPIIQYNNERIYKK